VLTVERGGVATGFSGSCSYRVEGLGDFILGFDNPFFGSNFINSPDRQTLPGRRRRHENTGISTTRFVSSDA